MLYPLRPSRRTCDRPQPDRSHGGTLSPSMNTLESMNTSAIAVTVGGGAGKKKGRGCDPTVDQQRCDDCHPQAVNPPAANPQVEASSVGIQLVAACSVPRQARQAEVVGCLVVRTQRAAPPPHLLQAYLVVQPRAPACSEAVMASLQTVQAASSVGAALHRLVDPEAPLRHQPVVVASSAAPQHRAAVAFSGVAAVQSLLGPSHQVAAFSGGATSPPIQRPRAQALVFACASFLLLLRKARSVLLRLVCRWWNFGWWWGRFSWWEDQQQQ